MAVQHRGGGVLAGAGGQQQALAGMHVARLHGGQAPARGRYRLL
jgi:hypothetical protein